jgi:hypothetical protein
MTKPPSRPWTTVEVDFCGPFPNCRYALVVTDQYYRYPEVVFTTTTSFEAIRKKLKKIFATHGVPQNFQERQQITLYLGLWIQIIPWIY